MSQPTLSAHFQARQPSAIRIAGIRFAARTDTVDAVNVAIGNVSLPMHPAMQTRLANMMAADGPFGDGVVKYTATVGAEETQRAFLHVIGSGGTPTEGLLCQVTDGGSQAMELVVTGCCGPAGTTERPLMLIDAAYTNYNAFASRLGRATVSITRTLGADGQFSLPPMDEVSRLMSEHAPGALVVIPYDNPTGQLYDRETLLALARLCVEHGVWLVSDEAYRELYYVDRTPGSVWDITEAEVPGISGLRISIETASKVWNACGLRIGALVTDNAAFHAASVAENTASLCPSAIGQHVFAALADEPYAALQAWYTKQRAYYGGIAARFAKGMAEALPEAMVSRPDAAIYAVVDVAPMVGPDFSALDFALYCASEGRVEVEGQATRTLLSSPMGGFYSLPAGAKNPGRTQLRIAFVESPERMMLVPELLSALLEAYLS